MFREATTAINNNNYLSEVFEENNDINLSTEKFIKRLNKTIQKCFRKIRVTEKVDKEKQKLFEKWKKMKNDVSYKNKAEFEKLESLLAEKYAEEYVKKIHERMGGIDSEDGEIKSGKIWKLKKDLFPRNRDPPTAMIDPESGNLLTEAEKIENAAVKVFKDRLKNKPMDENLKHIKDAKEVLCAKRLEIAKSKKTPPWSMADLEKVLKSLKKQKSRDPYGLANDLFRPEVAGDDLKLALLRLMNNIKNHQTFPKCLELCNISSIWKTKGPRNNFESHRGIFHVNIFRSILDKLIYNDEYEKIDKNLTDANVGARKNRNIRDNIFVLNAVMNSIKSSEKALDFQVYDIEKCFDSLWLEEVINALYEAGLQNDKLPLLFMENSNARVAVKTQDRISKRIIIQNIIMQGSIFGSLSCVVLMDKLAKYIYDKPELLYMYKGMVGTPPLQMVDDILGIQKCNNKSLQLNTAINTFVNLEKLKLSKKKCNNIHVGAKNMQCPPLTINGSEMHNSEQEKYLGDILDKKGTCRPNIENRKLKGYSISSSILAIVNEIPLGHWKIKAGLSLRQAMLLNGILFNSEAWQGPETKHITLLEKVDEALLRGILGAHPKIPLEALYLETRSIPIRFVVASRRILYLHTILQKDRNEMILKIFEAQKMKPSPGDFIDLVKNDFETIGWKITEEEIRNLSKQNFKKIVKSKISNAAFIYLKDMKKTHSKMNNVHYDKFEISKYLNSPLFSRNDRFLLLALRTRTLRGIRSDFPGLYKDRMCPLGCGDLDTIPNILTCSILKNLHKSDGVAIGKLQYEDIFSNDIQKQKQVTDLYDKLLEIRNRKISDSLPVACTGPLQSMPTLQSHPVS